MSTIQEIFNTSVDNCEMFEEDTELEEPYIISEKQFQEKCGKCAHYYGGRETCHDFHYEEAYEQQFEDD